MKVKEIRTETGKGQEQSERGVQLQTFPLYFPTFHFLFYVWRSVSFLNCKQSQFPHHRFMHICSVWFKVICCASFKPKLQFVFIHKAANISDVGICVKFFKQKADLVYKNKRKVTQWLIYGSWYTQSRKCLFVLLYIDTTHLFWIISAKTPSHAYYRPILHPKHAHAAQYCEMVQWSLSL